MQLKLFDNIFLVIEKNLSKTNGHWRIFLL